MARFRKGKYKKENDIWAKVGGTKKLVNALATHGVGKGKANWSTLAVHIFNSHPPNAKFAKWLQTVWTEDRRGVRREVLQTDRCSGKYVLILYYFIFLKKTQF